MDDKKTISNQYSEVRWVAQKFGIEVWQVYKIKSELGTNNRKLIYEQINKLINGTNESGN